MLSVVLEIPHPLGPVFRLDAAGSGPAIGRVVAAVPFERPEFLQADLSDGPVHEKTVYVRIVAVYAECVPFETCRGGDGVTLRRRLFIAYPRPGPAAIEV